MKNLIFFAILTWMLAGAGMVTGQEKEKVNPEIALPFEAMGWRWDGKELTYQSRALFDYMDGSAELYLAYGFQHLTVRRFEKQKQAPITVELYEMASSEDAYGVFSFERQDEPAGVGQGSEFGGGLLRFWKGRYFVAIYPDGEGADVEQAILTLARATANAIRAEGPEPKLVGLIPGNDLGLVDKSVRYLKSHILLNQRFFIAHQNILNLNRQAEAVLAQYARHQEKITLLIIRYPNPEQAAAAYGSFMKAYLPDAGGKDRSRTEDGKWTLARQQDRLVLIVFGASTEADAEALLRATKERLS